MIRSAPQACSGLNSSTCTHESKLRINFYIINMYDFSSVERICATVPSNYNRVSVDYSVETEHLAFAVFVRNKMIF